MSNSPADDIEDAIPKHLCDFVEVRCTATVDERFPQLCKAIGEAFQRFDQIPRRWKQISLIVVDDPPTIFEAICCISILPRKGLAGVTLDNTIVLRTSELLKSSYDFQVIAVLEELTHSLLNVRDENLATWIVSFLYCDKTAYKKGGYANLKGYEPHWPPEKDYEVPPFSFENFDVDCMKKKKPAS